MKFMHMSDCHIGGWQRNEDLRDILSESFDEAINLARKEKVDFILISGDIFDKAIPDITAIHNAVKKMKEARDAGIRIYVIEGSHDFSVTDKTMTKILDSAGIFTRVARQKRIKNDEEDGDDKLEMILTEDCETGAKITGISGEWRAGEEERYRLIDEKHIQEKLEKNSGFKIFMFHSGISEFKSKKLASASGFMPLSLLPKGFDYYAGGHIHMKSEYEYEVPGYNQIYYPGPLFPMNSQDLEEQPVGGVYLVTVEDDRPKVEWREINICDIVSIEVDASKKNPRSVEKEIRDEIEKKDVKGKIVVLRVEGTLESGHRTDIDFRGLELFIKEKHARTIVKREVKLKSSVYEKYHTDSNTQAEIEREHTEEFSKLKLLNINNEEKTRLINEIVRYLSTERTEGETKQNYKERIISEIDTVLGFDKKVEEIENEAELS